MIQCGEYSMTGFKESLENFARRSMHAESGTEQVILTLDRGEVRRLVAVLAEAARTSSRAEFFIRVGCSLPNIEAIVEALESVLSGESTEFELPVVAGVESEENPPRPRLIAETD